MPRKTCYDLIHKLQFKFTLSGHYTTNIYMSEIPLLDQFSYLLLTEQFYRYHSCRTPNICFSLENTGNENIKKSFHTFFHLSRQSGVSHTFDNLKIHRTIIIALVSNRLFLLSFLIFRRQSYGGWIIRCSLFTTLFFKKSVLFDLCQKIRPYI